MGSFTEPREASADVGVVGLAVMGQNLALNMADHGFAVAVFNRTTSVTERFVAAHPPAAFEGTGGSLLPARELSQFVRALKRPRRIVVMVKAGGATDAVIDSVSEPLDPGDCIVDGGNALHTDTVRREAKLSEKGIRFVGSGISGGEEGARFGPSLMPGGDPEAWKIIEPVWTAIAAKVDPETGKPLTGAAPGKPVRGGEPCAAYIGPGGSGHYVKMVHNGIEYADMQLICEAYQFMRSALGMDPARMSGVFREWNSGELDSFLIEITADILAQTDPVTGGPFVDVVLDAAGQKGTGAWTGVSALTLGVPAPTIVEAVQARSMSSFVEQRAEASRVLAGPPVGDLSEEADRWTDAVRDALYCSKICAYAQGFALMREASREHEWNLDTATIAKIWRGGCIIRARFLQKITEAYRRSPDLTNLLLDPFFAGEFAGRSDNWRSVVAESARRGVPAPAFASALAYFDAYRSERLPANLLQAQRDYFGAHTYERVDQPRGRFFHLDWQKPDRPQVDA